MPSLRFRGYYGLGAILFIIFVLAFVKGQSRIGADTLRLSKPIAQNQGDTPYNLLTEGFPTRSFASLTQGEEPKPIELVSSNEGQTLELASGSYIVILKEKALADRYSELTALQEADEATNQPTLAKPDHLQKNLNDQLARITQEQTQAIRDIKTIAPGGRVMRQFAKAINGVVLEGITAQQAQAMKDKGFGVEKNGQVQALMKETNELVKATQARQLTDTQQRPLLGTGIRIGIIDTGIDYTHPDLGGCSEESFRASQCAKVVGGYDFFNNDPNPLDDAGHGTHVASIAAGASIDYPGIAPGASLYAYKVLNQYGYGSYDDIIAAIERSMDPNDDCKPEATLKNVCFSDHLDIINLSLGGPGNPDDALSQAVDRATSVGVVTVVAAGNDGHGPNSTNFGQIDSPGGARTAITVAATTKEDKLADFSSLGPAVWGNKSLAKPDVAATGSGYPTKGKNEQGICAARLGAIYSDRVCDGESGKHVSFSGTSMATPVVAGSLALLRQVHPTWTPLQLKWALKTTAEKIQGDQYGLTHLIPWGKGSGRINIQRAVALTTIPTVMIIQPVVRDQTDPVVKIRGRIVGKDITGYKISYERNYSSEKSVDVKQVTFPAAVNKYDLAESVDLTKEGDDQYIIKIEVTNTSGESTSDYVYARIQKAMITSPLDYDIHRVGELVTPTTTTPESLKSFAQWSYTKLPTTYESVYETITSFPWNTSNLDTARYNLRLQVEHDGLHDGDYKHIAFDKTLEKGWPLRVPSVCPSVSSCYDIGSLYLTTEDIDGDRLKEVLFMKGSGLGNPTLNVYRSTGQLLWSKEVSNKQMQTHIYAPVIGQDQRGNKIIYVFASLGDSYIDSNFDNTRSQVYAFRPNGSILWSKDITKTHGATMSFADLNGDGKGELIVASVQGIEEANGRRDITILDGETGALLKSWPIGQNWLSYGWYMPSPVVGNFDDDSNLEITILRNGFGTQGIHIFNEDGTEISSSPIRLQGGLYSSPVVADLNLDGKDDLIFELDCYTKQDCQQIHAVDRDGKALAGWPVALSDPNSAPHLAVGDVDNNGEIEVAACQPSQCTLLRADGSVVPGWPKEATSGIEHSPAIGDISGDGKADVIIGSGGFGGLNKIGRTADGGIFAWNGNGELIPGFPKLTTVPAMASPIIDDLDYDQKLELIGSTANRAIYVWDLGQPLNSTTQSWTTYQHDVSQTGRFLASPPEPPTNLKAGLDGRKVKLSWVDRSANEDGFEITRSQVSNVDVMIRKILPGNVSQLTDGPLPEGQKYFYTIRSFRLIQGVRVYSPYSVTLGVVVPASVTIDPPTNVTLTQTAPTKVAVRWGDATPDEAGFEIWRAERLSKNMVGLVTTDANITEKITNVTPGQTYAYQVRAFRRLSDGTRVYSVFSSIISVNVPK